MKNQRGRKTHRKRARERERKSERERDKENLQDTEDESVFWGYKHEVVEQDTERRRETRMQNIFNVLGEDQ